MKFLEKDLEGIIYTADKAELGRRGLHVSEKLFRQLRIGKYGIADLVSVDRVPRFALNGRSNGKLWITVYELKKEKIGVSAFLQALGYVKGIMRYLDKRNFNFEVEISICLVGKSIDEQSTFCYLQDFLDEYSNGYKSVLDCYTYSYDINGISFERKENFNLKKEGF